MWLVYTSHDRSRFPSESSSQFCRTLILIPRKKNFTRLISINKSPQ